LTNIRNKLEALRKLTTGFDAAHGYDLRKPLTRSRIRTIEKYHAKLMELTNRPHILYAPKKGEKNEAFEYTTQKGYPRFRRAIIYTPDPTARITFSIDRARPRGSRFVATNRKTGQRHYHIPARAFLAWDHIADADFVAYLEEQGEDISELDEASFYQYVIEYYSDGEASFYMIMAGESFMWGSAGGAEKVAKKVDTIINNYGANVFDASDKNSSYYGNWFRGVMAYSDHTDAVPIIERGFRGYRDYMRKYNLMGDKKVKYRMLDYPPYTYGRYVDGVLTERFAFQNGTIISDSDFNVDYAMNSDGSISRFVDGRMMERFYVKGVIK
jgi:hypothetical protein